MLPEERACYVDLMIYQHQNGFIPKDLKRVLMFCSGVSESTLQTVLQAKFEQTPNGWLNTKLKQVIEERHEYKIKKSISGVIGQFLKKAKATLKPNDYKDLRALCVETDNKILHDIIKEEGRNIQAVLQALLKHQEDEDEIENEIEIENENEIEEVSVLEKEKINKKEKETPEGVYRASDYSKQKTVEFQIVSFLEKEFNYVFDVDHELNSLKQLVLKIKKVLQKHKKEQGFANFSVKDVEVYDSFQMLIKNLPQWVVDNKFSITYINKAFNEITQGIKSSNKSNGISQKSKSILSKVQ